MPLKLIIKNKSTSFDAKTIGNKYIAVFIQSGGPTKGDDSEKKGREAFIGDIERCEHKINGKKISTESDFAAYEGNLHFKRFLRFYSQLAHLLLLPKADAKGNIVFFNSIDDLEINILLTPEALHITVTNRLLLLGKAPGQLDLFVPGTASVSLVVTDAGLLLEETIFSNTLLKEIYFDYNSDITAAKIKQALQEEAPILLLKWYKARVNHFLIHGKTYKKFPHYPDQLRSEIDTFFAKNITSLSILLWDNTFLENLQQFYNLGKNSLCYHFAKASPHFIDYLATQKATSDYFLLLGCQTFLNKTTQSFPAASISLDDAREFFQTLSDKHIVNSANKVIASLKPDISVCCSDFKMDNARNLCASLIQVLDLDFQTKLDGFMDFLNRAKREADSTQSKEKFFDNSGLSGSRPSSSELDSQTTNTLTSKQ